MVTTRLSDPFWIPSFVNPRTQLVDELIERVKFNHIIRVRGTPASGKSIVLRLVANRLLEKYGQEIPIHTITGWDPIVVKGAGGWRSYLKQATDCEGMSWLGYNAFLLLDEAQQSYWDQGLWTDLFKSVTLGTQPFIILFMSYGSPYQGDVEHRNILSMAVPMVFADDRQVSLWPDEYSLFRRGKQVGLLLLETEAMDVVTRYAMVFQPPLRLSEDLKRGLFTLSNGHAGLLTSIVEALLDVEETYNLSQINATLDWHRVKNIIVTQPQQFFNSLRNKPFNRGLPERTVLQENNIARVLKTAITCEEVQENKLESGQQLKEALKFIWRNGWLHAYNSERGTTYMFATPIHRWYCHMLFSEIPLDHEIKYDTLLELAIDTIKRFKPSQLSNARRSQKSSPLPLEDQYQKELYRCLFNILDGRFILSPELLIKTGVKSGTIDFLISQKKWGLELLRDRDRLVEHMQGFESGGIYYSLIEAGEMEQYIVLDFTITKPTKSHPDYRGHLYHIEFCENNRVVNVIDASNLKVYTSFTLIEDDF